VVVIAADGRLGAIAGLPLKVHEKDPSRPTLPRKPGSAAIEESGLDMPKADGEERLTLKRPN